MAAKKTKKPTAASRKKQMTAAHEAYWAAIDEGFGNCDMDALISTALRAGVEELRYPDGYLRVVELSSFFAEYLYRARDLHWEVSRTERAGVEYDDDALFDAYGSFSPSEACEDVEISEEILLCSDRPESVIEACIGIIQGLTGIGNFAYAGMGGGGVDGYSAVKRGGWFAVYYDGDGESGDTRFWMEAKQSLLDDPELEAATKAAKEALGLYDWFDAHDPDDAYLVATFAKGDFVFNLLEALAVGNELSRGRFDEKLAERFGLESEEEIEAMHNLLAVPSDAKTPEERQMVWKVWDECREFYPCSD